MRKNLSENEHDNMIGMVNDCQEDLRRAMRDYAHCNDCEEDKPKIFFLGDRRTEYENTECKLGYYMTTLDHKGNEYRCASPCRRRIAVDEAFRLMMKAAKNYEHRTGEKYEDLQPADDILGWFEFKKAGK
jgi:hypothetical protein